MSEERTEDRARNAMRVTVTTAQGAWTGSVGDTSTAGASVAFPVEEAPLLPLGQRLQLTFSGGPLESPVEVEATLRSRSEGDFRRYGFTIEGDGRFGQRAPAAWGAYNRREHVRFRPDRPVPVKVTVDEGPNRGQTFEGRIADLSQGGLAAILEASAEDALGEVLQVRCTLKAAGASREETWRCTIRNRQLTDEAVRYGMAFVPDAAEADAAPPVYEPLWDCAACGTNRLLGHSHHHCPSCGAKPPHDRTYFPSWDEIITAADHPFHGEERRCACGATWSQLAQACGNCGERLS